MAKLATYFAQAYHGEFNQKQVSFRTGHSRHVQIVASLTVAMMVALEVSRELLHTFSK